MTVSDSDQMRRGVFLPLYFTVISLMVENVRKLMILSCFQGASVTVGSLGNIF